MSLRVDFIGFAEGAATDSRGNVSLIGFHPQVLIQDAFPSQVTPTLVLVASEDEQPAPLVVPGSIVTFRVEILGPDGDTLFVTEQQQPIGERRWRSLSGRLQVIAQIAFSANKPGDYKGRVTVTVTSAPPLVAEGTVRITDLATLEDENRADEGDQPRRA